MNRKMINRIITGICIAGMVVPSALPVLAAPLSENSLDAADAKEATEATETRIFPEADLEADYVEDEILVVLNDRISDAAAIDLLNQNDCAENIEIENVDDSWNYAVVELSDGMDVAEALEYYEDMPEVLYAQPNYIYEIEEENSGTAYTVNDPFFVSQWYLDAINAPEAWGLLEGKTQQDVLVAIIDTGIDLTHPDLYPNIDVEHCVSSVTTEYLPISNDFTGHGTHIAGEIAAVFDNEKGIAGISNNHAKIAAIQCSDGSTITTTRVANGIDYAISIDAQIINMSLGMSSEDMVLKNALQRAYDAGILTVCSAGNDGTDAKHYPSAYDTTIGIISSGQNGLKRPGGSYGTDNFMSAPGESNYSTIPTDSYGYKSGSSMSAGVVTGVIALMLSVDPTLTPEQIKQLLAETATDTYEEGFDAYSGYGIVNAEAVIGKMIGTNDNNNGNNTSGSDNENQDNGNNNGNNSGSDNENQDNGNNNGNSSGSDNENQNNDNQDNGDNNGSNGITEIPDSIKNPNTATDFVKRLYYYSFGREADEAGLQDWSNRLTSQEENGGQVVMGFLFSDEFLNKNCSNEEYVMTLYRVFLGREPDQDGKQYWLGKLNSGMSRLHVMNGFSSSDEFTAICDQCGFSSGQVQSGEYRDQNEEVTAFVARLYEKVLGRTYDEVGINYWCESILTGRKSAQEVAVTGFFQSAEFLNKEVSDQEFVKILYQTFFDRDYDEAGYQDWCNRLQNGWGRDDVIRGFANSKEFANLKNEYGL